MADCLTQYSTQQLKSRVLWLYNAHNSPSMNKILLLLCVFMSIFIISLLTYLPKLDFFIMSVSKSNRWLITGVSDGFSQLETSVVRRGRQKLPIDPEVSKEAVSALRVALDLQAQGKTKRARKVFQQALALDPGHADILTAYGEFLERHVDDVLQADHYYTLALKVSPQHSQALLNRRRTDPLVQDLDQQRLHRIDHKRSLFHTVPAHHPAMRRAKREAYFAHIYHSNAIEGNTLTLTQTRVIVETGVAVGGKSLTEQSEVLGLDAALGYINGSLVGRVGQVTLQDVLDLHLRVLGYVDPSQAGRWRSTQVYVGEFTPPAAVDVPLLMEEFASWLRSDHALALHPVLLAALAHYRLVAVHPFHDGNGRTSRLLMNLIFMQAGYPPVVIRVGDRQRYFETLQHANNGDVRPFIRFIADATERTLDEYLAVTLENPGQFLQQASDKSNSTGSQRIIYMDSDN